ncbi:MAG: hypothetical protein ACRCYU_05490 [Nocardioides sp.]
MKPLLRQAWTIGRGLTVLAIVNLVLLLVSIVARFTDDTVVNGISVWDKPIKFAISFLAYAPMLLWLFSRIERTRPIRFGLGVLGWSMIVEISVIFLQSARGTASHFNNATTLDGLLYNIMAAGVGVFSLAGLLTGLVLTRKRLGSGALALATKLAIPMMTVGGVLGFAMTGPKPGQDEAGGKVIGAHTVGGPDTAEGIAFLGWSTEHGDLRVAHFLGLHSLHVVPLIALIIIRMCRRGVLTLNERGQRVATAFGATAWAGLVAAALIQALRGVPVTNPDDITWTSLFLLAGVPAAIAAGLAVRPPSQFRPAAPLARSASG